ncbi:unnamed protein product [Urochloa humidicola]
MSRCPPRSTAAMDACKELELQARLPVTVHRQEGAGEEDDDRREGEEDDGAMEVGRGGDASPAARDFVGPPTPLGHPPPASAKNTKKNCTFNKSRTPSSEFLDQSARPQAHRFRCQGAPPSGEEEKKSIRSLPTAALVPAPASSGRDPPGHARALPGHRASSAGPASSFCAAMRPLTPGEESDGALEPAPPPPPGRTGPSVVVLGPACAPPTTSASREGS